MNDQKRDNIEIRLNKDGSIDEIVITDPHDQRCLFHLEQMDDYYYWMRAYGITQDLVAHIGATMGKVRGDPIFDEVDKPGSMHGSALVDGKLRSIKGFEQLDGPVVNSNFEWEDAHHEDEHTLEAYRTPEDERLESVKFLLGRFGIDQVLNDLMVVYGQGRREPHDLELIKEVQQLRTRFAAAEKAFWDKKYEEWKKESI